MTDYDAVDDYVMENFQEYSEHCTDNGLEMDEPDSALHFYETNHD